MTSLKMAAGCDVCSTPNTKEMWRFSKQTDTKRRRLKDIPRSFHPSLSLLLLFFFLQNVSCQTNTNILNPQITSSSIVLPELQASSLVCKLDTTISPTSSDFPLTWGRSGGLPTAATVQTSQRDVGGGVTSYETRIRFTPTALDNQLRFSCNAQVGVFTGVAYYSPQIILRPDTPVITGPDVVNAFDVRTWTCVSTGSSYIAPNVYWRNGRGRSLTDGVDKVTVVGVEERDNTVFTITNTITFGIPAEMGNYTLQCIVIHEYAGYTASVTSRKFVTVYFLPQITKSDADILYTTQSIRQTISCIITASSPAAQSVSWTKDGAPIDFSGNRYEAVSVSSPSLIIKEVTDKDEGNYTCSVTNSNGTSSWPTPTRLIVRYSPIIVYTGVTNFVGSIGGSLTIPCPVDAVPAATTIRWWKYVPGGRQAIRPASDPRYSGGTAQAYGLTINPVQAGDATTYFCEADNDVGTGTGSNVTVTVNFDPVITVPDSVSGAEGQNLVIPCDPQMFPTPTGISWYKNNALINVQGNPTKYTGGTLSTPSLTILNPTGSDSGTYRCSATNGQDTVNGDITVTVTYKPKVTITSSEITTNENQNVVIQVAVDSSPAADSVVWKRADIDNPVTQTDVTKGGRISGGTVASPSLTINNVGFGDVANYYVTVTNSEGSTTVGPVPLRVRYQPTNVVARAIPSTLLAGERLVLSCSADAYPNPTFAWFQGGQQRASTANYTKIQTSSSDFAEFTCSVTNELGTSSATVTPNVRFAPFAPVAVINKFGTLPSSLDLECEIRANPLPTTYSWFKGNSSLSFTTRTITILLTSVDDLGTYSCTASNSLGSLNPPLQINVQQGTEETTPAAGASTNNEDDGLSTATIILIVVIAIIVLIIIILLLIFCCIQGVFAKCCGKSKESAKVAPTQQKRNDLNGVPPPFPFPAEQMNGDIEKPERIEITPRTPLAPIPAGAIISVPEKAGPRAHYLPPLTSGTENVDNYYREEKRRSRKKKKHRRHRKDDQNALTGMEEDGAESSPTPRTQREEDVGTSNVYEQV